jgi:hypothetical protein
MTYFGSRRFDIRSLIVSVLVTLIPLAPGLRAAEPEAEPAGVAAAPQDRPSGFRLKEPRAFLGVHSGMNFPRAGSDLFDMVTRELTLEKSDFRSPVIGFDLGIPIQSRFAAVFSFDFSSRTKVSESRNYVDEKGLSINQTTRFRQIPITGTLRFYPIKMGETIGNYAWIPARVAPYIGGGGGVVYYSFMQWGSFVDSQTLDIFGTSLRSSGFAAAGHIAGGVDIGLTSRILVTAEARYSFARADLSNDFVRFQPLDLYGLRATAGVCFRF